MAKKERQEVLVRHVGIGPNDGVRHYYVVWLGNTPHTFVTMGNIVLERWTEQYGDKADDICGGHSTYVTVLDGKVIAVRKHYDNPETTPAGEV